MKVQLLVSEWCEPCGPAEEIWREVARTRDIEFDVLDMAQPEAREIARRLGIRTIPSVVIDDELKAVGVQTKGAALAFVADAPLRASPVVRHVGLLMEPSSRTAVIASTTYLFVFGAIFAWYAGLPQSEPPRLAAIHLFTLGFVTFMIYGLGEHLLPRFTGNPIRFGAWAWVQQGVAHLGIIGFVAGSLTGAQAVLSGGAVLAWIALFIFTARILPVLWPRARRRPASGRATQSHSTDG